MPVLGEQLVRITDRAATFGLIVQEGRIVRAAPIAKWTVGKAVEDVIAHYRRRGAHIDLV